MNNVSLRSKQSLQTSPDMCCWSAVLHITKLQNELEFISLALPQWRMTWVACVAICIEMYARRRVIIYGQRVPLYSSGRRALKGNIGHMWENPHHWPLERTRLCLTRRLAWSGVEFQQGCLCLLLAFSSWFCSSVLLFFSCSVVSYSL